MIKSFSLILPAYRQEKTIVTELKMLDEVMSSLNFSYEIIVVVDGDLDNTFKKAKRLKIENLKVFRLKENIGKGFAVKYGVEKSKGEVIGFIDSGMDLDPNEISLMIDIMEWKKADIVVGSKLHPDSKVNYPWGRKILSWGYRLITHTLFDLSVKDTQVGLKLFKKKVAKDVFPRIVVKKFAFDVEVLAVAIMLGYDKIYEAPIKLRFKPGSVRSTNFWKISFQTLWDTLAVFYRMNILRYYSKYDKKTYQK